MINRLYRHNSAHEMGPQEPSELGIRRGLMGQGQWGQGPKANAEESPPRRGGFHEGAREVRTAPAESIATAT